MRYRLWRIIHHWLILFGSLYFTSLCLSAKPVHTPLAILEVSPTECVVMRADTVCDAEIRLSWTLLNQSSRVCLRELPVNEQEAELCWPDATFGQALLRRSLSESLILEIYDPQTGIVFAAHQVDKKWVYGPKKLSLFNWLIKL